MKAVLCPKSGSPAVLNYGEAPKPKPNPNEVLIKVHYSSVTSGDVKLRQFNRIFMTIIGFLFGFKPMDITGVEYSGVVEEVGSEVKNFALGNMVCGTTTGLKFGGNAEYVCVPENPKMGVITLKPEKVPHKEAGCTPVGAMTAQWFLKKADLQKENHILIYGASGSVGTFALQLAKVKGCEVTAVCSSANKDLMNALGADHVIDYSQEDFTLDLASYDVIFDAVGKLKKSTCRKALKGKKVYVSVKTITSERVEDLKEVLDLMSTGQVKAVLDREYPLSQIREAHAYVDSGRKKGNLAIQVISQ